VRTEEASEWVVRTEAQCPHRSAAWLGVALPADVASTKGSRIMMTSYKRLMQIGRPFIQDRPKYIPLYLFVIVGLRQIGCSPYEMRNFPCFEFYLCSKNATPVLMSYNLILCVQIKRGSAYFDYFSR